ncbi:S-adenosyl-L-methionine-dependent methyltransferase [Rhizodiscina lignyota]|uniref:S-adenosyl-L-methionine-dependent methyltransferase n=1 Tax=Rhizodiscina lignyota TaxID=1504668 RepID=A0A9P4I7X4_9PEZI|nr:S-adenosyl-L-methionine-dependent methyltransferase [Rhizodiscina lignyota]
MSESVGDEYRETVEIHDRDFQLYSIQNRIYFVPVDDEEEERLQIQHRVFSALWEGRLFFPPLSYPRRILDLGYGQGEWAVAMAEQYENSQVTAVDIWHADLPDQPDNLDCEHWNLNDPLTPTYKRDHYDFIHSRCVSPGIKKDRWRSYVRDIYRLLRRGGWAQLVEYYFIVQSDNGRINDDNPISQWGTCYRRSMEGDRDPRAGRHIRQLMRDSGFSDVQEQIFHVPIGSWHNDERMRNVGTQNVENVSLMLDSHAIWPFTHRLGWTAQQVGWLTDGARTELRDDSLKLYMPLSACGVGT